MQQHLAILNFLLVACGTPTNVTSESPVTSEASKLEDTLDAFPVAASELEVSRPQVEPGPSRAIIPGLPLEPYFSMTLIQGGTESLGCTDGQRAGMPEDATCTEWEEAYTVTLTNDFWLGKTEVTHALWSEVTGAPIRDCPDCPISGVSWHGAAGFLNTMSRFAGLEECYGCEYFEDSGTFCYEIMDPYTCGGYRLPTEAEWEFGARCGQDLLFSGSKDFYEVAWVKENAGEQRPVALLEPNACGLYDMSGNMFEWAHDWYIEERSDSYLNPYGPPAGTERLARGGAYDFHGLFSRVSFRDRCRRPEHSFPNQGFRLARTAH